LRPSEHPAITEAKRRQARRDKGQPLTESFEPADRCNLTLMGPPRTKKNSLVALGVQSPAYRKYRADALQQLQFAKRLEDRDYNLSAQFYVDGWGKSADLTGLLQALADILQDAGIVTNDRQFAAFDGSRVHRDHDSECRTELTITPVRQP
jgi:Holliday junction resolvase RusA-like endonuclease